MACQAAIDSMNYRTLVVNTGATWPAFQPQIQKTKKAHPEKVSYIFQKIFFSYFGMTADPAVKLKKILVP